MYIVNVYRGYKSGNDEQRALIRQDIPLKTLSVIWTVFFFTLISPVVAFSLVVDAVSSGLEVIRKLAAFIYSKIHDPLARKRDAIGLQYKAILAATTGNKGDV